MYKKNKHIHFVGIGGIGMSGIAELLLNLGYRVSGSDLRQTRITDRLASLGGIIHQGHQAQWIEGAEVVVVSSAIGNDNPEVVAAGKRHVPVVPRAEMLAELMRLKKYGVAIAGSHGKTSTTSLVSWVMAQAGLDPTVVIGGQVNSLGTNARLGDGEFLVAEADESDGSFLRLAPVLEVVTNIDLEHLDFYASIDEIKEAFLKFINKVPFYGAVILCLDDDNIVSLLPRIKKRVITYGFTAQADLHARGLRNEGFVTFFEVWMDRELLGEVRINFPGRHNVLNSLAAIAAGLELEIPFASITGALAEFSGVERRLQLKGEAGDITVIDDYAHHPTEVRATLTAMRRAWSHRRLVVIFQPHRYSRTSGLFREFCASFHEADLLLLAPIYAAGEEPITGIDSSALAHGIKEHGQRMVESVDRLADLEDAVLPLLEPGDVVITLGAGNIWQSGERILARLVGERQ